MVRSLQIVFLSVSELAAKVTSRGGRTVKSRSQDRLEQRIPAIQRLRLGPKPSEDSNGAFANAPYHFWQSRLAEAGSTAARSIKIHSEKHPHNLEPARHVLLAIWIGNLRQPSSRRGRSRTTRRSDGAIAKTFPIEPSLQTVRERSCEDRNPPPACDGREVQVVKRGRIIACAGEARCLNRRVSPSDFSLIASAAMSKAFRIMTRPSFPKGVES